MPNDKPIRIRGFLGEQSFEITEGHDLVMASFGEAMVFNSTYRTERQLEVPAPEARQKAATAVKAYKEAKQ